MAIIVEDGTIVSGANSFVSIADTQAFFDARDITITITEAMLLRAMDSLSTLSCLAEYTLPLTVEKTIPVGLIRAQEWLCYYENAGYSLTDAAEQKVKREKVDSLETEYFTSGGTKVGSISELPHVANNLRAMGCTHFGAGVPVYMDRA